MRFSVPVLAALATSATATTAPIARTTMFTLEIAPGETIEVTEDEKFALIDQGKHFFDITEFKEVEAASARLFAALPFPNGTYHKCAVKEIIDRVDTSRIEAQLTEYTKFHNRYFNSQYGVAAAEWLFERVKEAITESGNPLATARLVRHTAWAQPSIIVSVPGIIRGQTVVVGSHLDSVISNDRGAGRAPGADDNGSGSLMILEVLRAFLADPRIAEGDHRNTLEWHWYGAEESGLLGSQDIFSQYAALGMQVVAMLNQDMVGFKGRDGIERFGLVTDFTDASQNEYLKKLIGEYADIPYEESLCGYGCSDHASANRNGYPSSFLFEAPFGNHNPHIHTPNDTMQYVDFEHVLQHAKVTSGFVYELAHHPFVAA